MVRYPALILRRIAVTNSLLRFPNRPVLPKTRRETTPEITTVSATVSVQALPDGKAGIWFNPQAMM